MPEPDRIPDPTASTAPDADERCRGIGAARAQAAPARTNAAADVAVPRRVDRDGVRAAVDAAIAHDAAPARAATLPGHAAPDDHAAGPAELRGRVVRLAIAAYYDDPALAHVPHFY